jgi:hypothetical protein
MCALKCLLDTLWIKPTDALNSSFIGITTLHVSGSLSAHHQEFLAYISFGTYAVVYRWCSSICCRINDKYNTYSAILLLVADGSSQLHKKYQSRCTAKNSWWWAERLLETCRVVIPIKLEFSASVGFIHKEFVTMHGHTVVKSLLVTFLYGCHLTKYYSTIVVSKLPTNEGATDELQNTM